MKLRYIITSLLAVLALAIGCTELEEAHLSEVQVSQSYIALPVNGGSVDVTVNATSDWAINDIPEWLTVSPASGAAGKYTVTFHAEAATATNEAILHLVCDGATQVLNVLQMAEAVELPISPISAVLAGEDGTTYRVKGTVGAIQNSLYGNYNVTDETGTIYVYGTLYEGAEKQFEKLGIEQGDIVTIEGPKTTYGSTIELVNVTVIAIEKSLIKVDSVEPEDAMLPIEGGEFKVNLSVKGEGVSVDIPEAAKAWLSVAGLNVSGSAASVVFVAASNEGGDRSVELTFKTSKGGVEYTAATTLTQEGAIIDATVAEFLAAAEDQTQYRVTGVIRSVSASSKYHNADLVIAGGLGETVTIYRAVTKEGNIEDLGLEVGDMVTFVGKRSSYNGAPQMAQGGVYVSHERYTKATVAEFLAAEENDVVYAVSGEIVEVKDLSDKYNNVGITVKDGENSVFLYRVTTFDKSSVATLNPQVGGKITVAGKRGSYNGTPQMAAGGICLEYTAPAGEEPGGDVNSESILMANCFSEAITFEVGKTYKMGSLTCSYDKQNNSASASNFNAGDPGVRFYAHDVLTFSAEKEFTKLEFVYYGGKKGPVTVETGTVEDTGTAIVWTGSAKSVAFEATSQVRFNEIKVTYK
ncbi:MAG: BACON domain-containing protein [Candidatus Cryptobacteroides sp.]